MRCTRFELIFGESATFTWVTKMDEIFFKPRKGCGFSIDSCVVIKSSTSDIIITLKNYFKATFFFFFFFFFLTTKRYSIALD